MKYVLAIVLALASSIVCAASEEDVEREVSAAFERSDWTRAERRAFTLSVVAHTLDLATSVASDERCVERNPLLGENPSNAQLLGVKVVAVGFEYWLYSHSDNPNVPWFGYTMAALHFATAASNLRNNCY